MSNISEYKYQILKLDESFYKTYPNPPYIEILTKNKRSYNCLSFSTQYDFLICIPYRSEIKHRYSYLFKNSKRSKKHRSGLDYTKIVIIKDIHHLESMDSVIDQDEYNETRENIDQIKTNALSFLNDYVYHKNKIKLLDTEEFARRYSYSPLKYFHKELNIQCKK